MYGSIANLGHTGIECAPNQVVAHCQSKIDFGYLPILAPSEPSDHLAQLGKRGTHGTGHPTLPIGERGERSSAATERVPDRHCLYPSLTQSAMKGCAMART
jgi:hypothetical protein